MAVPHPAAVAREDDSNDAAFPEKAFSGIGGIADFGHRLITSARLVERCRVYRGDARISDRAECLKRCVGMSAARPHGWNSMDDFIGLRRNRVSRPFEDPRQDPRPITAVRGRRVRAADLPAGATES